MRTIIDLPQEQIDALDQIRGNERSRAALIREAVALYLAQQPGKLDTLPAFGIWRDRHIDSLAYEDSLRDEWQR
ncbi:MAG: ribbon-helix-helix protein, CopG family [Caldilineaceae bacterium]|nr:ribbon-helix-helix protein, CopG family [Caldilineaceae bacterium]